MGYSADFDNLVSSGLLNSEGSNRPSLSVRPGAPSSGDLIQEVRGVSAAEVLLRCAQIRAMRPHPVPMSEHPPWHSGTVNTNGATRWRLLDLGDGSREEFIDAAHLALLCRKPYANEVMRRIIQLRTGRTRLEIILRLALSAEGRRLKRHCVAGVGLPALLRFVRGLDYLARSPIMAPVLRATRR